MKICVVGLGEVGSVTFDAILRDLPESYELVGVDISKEARNAALSNADTLGLPAEVTDTIPKGCDVYIISVWSREALLSVLRHIKSFIWCHKNTPLVSIESTIHPSDIPAIHYIFKDCLDSLVTFPHRLMPGDPEHQVFNLNRVLGGFTTAGQMRGWEFYKTFMRPPSDSIPCGTFEQAALSKVMENAYRFIQIAIAQEFAVAFREGFDEPFPPLRQAMRTKWNIDIPEARDGVKGKCLPKDIQWFLEAFPKSKIARAAIESNEEYKDKHGKA